MARRKRNQDDPIGVGMTAKQMRRRKPINADMMVDICLLYTSPSPRDAHESRMPSSA